MKDQELSESYFRNKGLFINGITHLSPKEAYDECQHGAAIIDLRKYYQYKQFDVENVIYAQPDYIKENYSLLPRDKGLIFADEAGVHSKEMVKSLMDKGFDNIANLIGGIVEWDRDGLPLKVDNSEKLTGQCMCMLKKRNR